MQVFIRRYAQGVTLESLIILYVYKNCFNDSHESNVKIFIVNNESDSDEPLFYIECSDFDSLDVEEVPEIAYYCKWPVAVVGNTVIAGLAAVARYLLKKSNDARITALLGFRAACLMACNEVSVWTKFCEIDIIAAVKDVVKNLERYRKSVSITLPVQLTRFEYHMSQPIRIHNVYKLARMKNRDNLIKSNTPITQLNIDHTYSEGPFMTLADLLLFPCFKIIFDLLGNTFENDIPLTNAWYKNLSDKLKELDISDKCNMQNRYVVQQEKIEKQSLYKGESRQNHNYTRQDDVSKLLKLTRDLLVTNATHYINGTKFAWELLPLEANPVSGALPHVRANRKCEQLENLAKATIKIASNKACVIVDFCSGSGHLGLILACALPSCHVILVENKERSLLRAQERIHKMSLKNITIVQSNLDYFVAPFDIGTALHACGVATDLVMQTCINNKADFVVCPCCYGGIHDCHHLSYPRSKTFKEKVLSYEEYLILGHASDQTHDGDNVKTAQGFACMDVIDSDRKLFAEECGYTVYLNKLIPPSCTPKNNLLIGIFK